MLQAPCSNGRAFANVQASIASKKKELQKRTTELKTRQKEVQTAELELGELYCSSAKLTATEQMEADYQAAAEEIEEIVAAVDKGQAEHGKLEKSLASQKVRAALTVSDASRKTMLQQKRSSRLNAPFYLPSTKNWTISIATSRPRSRKLWTLN